MLSKVLTEGDRIELKRVVKREEAESKPKTYVSQLNEIISEELLDIAIPTEGSKLVLYDVGTRLELRFITPAGSFVCTVAIQQRCKQGTRTFYIVKLITELMKDQRRQYFRLDKVMDIKYHKASGEEMEIMDRIRRKAYRDEYEFRAMASYLSELKLPDVNGILSNISGGGVKFYSKEALEKGDVIRLKIEINEISPEPLDLFGKIVASGRARNQNIVQEHRVEFINLNRDLREKIVRYIFDEDRKIRRKVNAPLS